MTYALVNYVAFTACWFACILGAAGGRPWIGPACVLVFAAVHTAVGPSRGDRPAQAALLVLAGLVGYAADSALVLLGILSFPAKAVLGWPSSLWMVALWVNFGTTLNSSMAWLAGRPVVAGVFGAVGGPLAYLAGVRFGAAALGPDLRGALIVIALEWALALPLLARLADVVGVRR